MQNHFEIYFTIFGQEFDQNELSKNLEIESASIWRKGEHRVNTKLLFEDYGWSISLQREGEFEIVEEIGKLFEMISNKIASLKAFIIENKLESELGIVVYKNSISIPEISINQNIISILNELNSSIDIDIM